MRKLRIYVHTGTYEDSVFLGKTKEGIWGWDKIFIKDFNKARGPSPILLQTGTPSAYSYKTLEIPDKIWTAICYQRLCS